MIPPTGIPTSVLGATSPEADLPAFVGLTAVVIAGFLVLARLSQGVVDDPDALADDRSAVDLDGQPRTPRERDFGGADHRDQPDASDRESRATPRAAAERLDADGPESSAPADESSGRGHGEVETAGDAHDRGPETGPGQRTAGRAATDVPESMSPGVLLANVALTQGLFGALLAVGAWYFRVPPDVLGMTADSLSTGPSALAVGVGFGAVLWVGNELAAGLAAASGTEYDEELRELLAPDGVGGWALLLGATLPVIAVVEEFIFRAAAVGAASAGLGASPWPLAVVSSAAFALGHGAQGRVGIAVTGGLGLALAAGFVLTESLLVVVVAHYLVNALEFVVHEGLGLADPVWESTD